MDDDSKSPKESLTQTEIVPIIYKMLCETEVVMSKELCEKFDVSSSVIAHCITAIGSIYDVLIYEDSHKGMVYYGILKN